MLVKISDLKALKEMITDDPRYAGVSMIHAALAGESDKPKVCVEATNGHALVRIERDALPDEEFPAPAAHPMGSLNGTPNVLLPADAGRTLAQAASKRPYIPILAWARVGKIGEDVQAFSTDMEKVAFVRGEAEGEENKFPRLDGMIPPETKESQVEVTFNVVNLRRLLDAILAAGDDPRHQTVTLRVYDAESAVRFDSQADGAEIVAVLMPSRK